MSTNTSHLTLAEAFESNGSQYASRDALVFLSNGEATVVSARDLFAIASRYAASLAEGGISEGDLVILVLQHSLELVYAFWGAVLLGAIPSIFPFLTEKLDPDLYRERIKLLVENSSAKAVLTDEKSYLPLRQLLEGVECELFGVETFENGEESFPSSDDRNPEAVALLQHSSGSTGLQKGVALTNRAVMDHVTAYAKAIDLQPRKDVVVSWLPLYHDMGLIAGFVLPIVTATPLVMMSPFEWVRRPQMLLEAMAEYSGTLCWLPNFAYNLLARTMRLTESENLDLSSIRALINCSEPVRESSHMEFSKAMGRFGFRDESLASCYAMAENTFAVTQSNLGQVPRTDVVETEALQLKNQAIASSNGLSFVSNGSAIDGVELLILDGQGKPLPERSVGEVALRSPYMLSEYYKRPDLTKKALTKDGWYLTGDMGYLAEGELYITGRKKDLIIVGGKNIYPQDLEEIANRVEGIYPGRAVAFGVFDDRLGSEKVVMVCETEYSMDDRPAVAMQLRAQVVKEIEVTLGDVRMVDRGWVIKTSSGKLARSDNREKYTREFLKQA